MALLQRDPFPSEERQEKKSNILIDILQIGVILFSIFVIIYLFIATPNEVYGPSMEPSFYNGELLLTNKFIQLFGETNLQSITGNYKRGDIVIFRSDRVDKDLIKRVVAIGGDTIMIRNGNVFVNGQKTNELYLASETKTASSDYLKEGKSREVPEHSYAVLGDNRGNSLDSRSSLIGFVSRKSLKGRVFVRFWPLNHLNMITRPDYDKE